MWLHRFQNQIHWCHWLTDERKVSCVVSVIDEQHSLEDTPCVLHWKAIIFQISVPRPHPLHHTGLNVSRRSNGERSMTNTQQWSNHPIPALISSYEPLPSPFKLNICFRWLFNGITICGGGIQIRPGHTSYSDRKHWRVQNHTLPQRPVTAYNWFLSNNVQNVTFMN